MVPHSSSRSFFDAGKRALRTTHHRHFVLRAHSSPSQTLALARSVAAGRGNPHHRAAIRRCATNSPRPRCWQPNHALLPLPLPSCSHRHHPALQRLAPGGRNLGAFAGAPRLNPKVALITGVVCGVRVESVADPLMQKIRYLDKLIDELAKGKKLESILRG